MRHRRTSEDRYLSPMSPGRTEDVWVDVAGREPAAPYLQSRWLVCWPRIGRSKNVVSILVRGDETRTKEGKRKREWLIGFCCNLSVFLGLA
jgi:hypothetical protein